MAGFDAEHLGCADGRDVDDAGRDTPEIYVQGFSTGLPERLQLHMLRTLPGLESCKMLRPAYAVEYDFFPAMQCDRSLQTRTISGLFFSGQLNGTTGYEEAAAQVRELRELPEWRFGSGRSGVRGLVRTIDGFVQDVRTQSEQGFCLLGLKRRLF